MLKALGGFASTGGGGGVGAVTYKGTWDADTNNPDLVNDTPDQGDYYVVNVAGNTDLDGITDWEIGDWAIFNGSIWQKVDNTDSVNSVNGQVGTVVLTAGNVDALPDTTQITGGVGIDVSGNLDANDLLVSLANTTVVAGTYGNASAIPILVIDAQGRITNANTAALTGTVTSVNGQSGVVVLNASDVNAVADTVFVNATGLLTGGGQLTGNVAIDLANVPAANVSGLGTIATQDANNVNITGGVIEVSNLVAANVTVTANLYANLTTSSTATFATSSLPLVPEGYIEIELNGATKKIPYYGV